MDVNTDIDWDELKQRLRSPKAKVWYGIALVALLLLFGLYLSVRFNGIVATIVYAIAFVFAATFFPIAITILRNGTPFGGAIGKLQFTLGQFCFGVGYLVERDDRYEWCPGTREKVWIDGEWRVIEGGQQNLTKLGWRPFGMLKCKSKGKDSHPFPEFKPRDGSGNLAADGGGHPSVERGDALQKSLEAARKQRDGPIIDLKRVMNSNIQKIGDTELIERVEEIIERGEVQESQMSSWGPIVGSIVGLVIGVIVGYAVLYL